MKRLAALAAFLVVGSAQAQWTPETEWGAVPFTVEYTLANGRLAAPQYRSFAGVVAGQLDLRRIWVNALVLDGDTMAVEDVQGVVHVAPKASWYSRVTYMRNTGTGGIVGTTTRLHCENPEGGYCIGHKTAVRSAAPAKWGVWHNQIGIGPGVDISTIVSCDEYGPCPQPLPHYTVIGSNVDITGSVLRWNRSPGSTGDLLQILAPDGRGVIFRIDGEGRVHLPSGRVLE